MQIGLYQAATGMLANMAAQENISANLSRQGIAGHRQRVATFEVDATQLRDQAMRSSRQPKITAMNIPLQVKSSIDFTQGPVQSTGSPLDIAIEGKSFFKVKGADGEIGYTRNGSFTRQVDGRVTTSDGAGVLLDGGDTLSVGDVAGLRVSQDGRIFDGKNELGRLALARFDKPAEALTESGPGRFVVSKDSGQEEISGADPMDRIVQGSIEGSNTSVVSQMVNMVQVSRAYESNQKAIAAQDDATSKLIAAARG